jgi:DNA-directed RNA polymerase alpha subunit
MSIEAMKLALEALEEVQMAFTTTPWMNRRIEDLRAAIAQEEKQEPRTPISVLDLTVRAEHLLRRGRVYDIQTLRSMDVKDILAIPDVGKKTLKEINEALLRYEMVAERKLMQKQRDQQATPLPKRKLPVITDDEIMNQWLTVMKNTEGTALPILEFARAITAKLENA